MAEQAPLIETLFNEMRARIKEDDSTVPQQNGDYLYWSEFEEGAQYRKHWRKPVAGGSAELLLDENALAEGLEYFRLGAATVSQNGHYLAYSADTNGSERYTARIKNLSTGEHLPDVLENLRGDLVWVANDTALVYGPATEEWRTLEAKLHVIGTPNSEDVTLYQEQDLSFSVGTGLSAQDDWLLIVSGDNETMVPAAMIVDQDTDNLKRIQRGLLTTRKPGVTLASYQKSRIRHFHQTLDTYMAEGSPS